MLKQAVILAGGKGTRIRELVGDMPKPMLKIGGQPLLEHQIRLAHRHGIRKILILVSHNSHVITDYFRDGADWDVSITYRKEDSPLGTAGAVISAYDDLEDQFLVMYGDTMLNVDLMRFWASHVDSSADISLFLHPNDHPRDSDLVELDEGNWVKAFHPYPHPEGIWRPNLVNAALYMMNKTVLQPWRSRGDKLDFGKNLFPDLLARGTRIRGYKSAEYIKDVGTMRRYDEVSRAYASGRIERGSLAAAKPAIFLDRDGTLVEEVNGLTEPEQLVLLDQVPEAIHEINKSEYHAVLVTNQPVVAKGQCSVEQLTAIHNKLETCLGEKGAYLDGIYYCPHHPDRGFPGERPELKFRCACRKPNLGMIERAVADLNIDLSKSWGVGDSTVDMETARRAGLRSALVRTGYGGRDGKFLAAADYEFFDFQEAVGFILQGYPGMRAACLEWARTIRAGDTIVIGGLARSGKTLLTKVLSEVLGEKGFRVQVVNLDAWIVGQDQRGSDNTLRDRFDYGGIGAFATGLCARRGDWYAVPEYDRLTGLSRLNARRMAAEPGAVLIFEGVPALDISALVAQGTLKIYVRTGEARRRKTFLREYAARGWTPEEAEALYHDRSAEENPIVEERAVVADLIWENVS